MASLMPDYVPTLANFGEAWETGDFIRYGINTIVICGGILAVQIVTISLAAYAFARMRFPGRELLFYVFLLQMMLVPVVLHGAEPAHDRGARPLRHAASA